MADDKQPKIGAGHAEAMWRRGLAELRAAPYPESNVAQPTQGGMYGTATPREVYEIKHGDGLEPNADRDGRGDEKGGSDREPETPGDDRT